MKPASGQSLFVLLSAPSGGGKTTVCEQVLARNPEMGRVITCTTRAPREGEQHGVDYYFLESADFQKRLETGEFLEHANVHGNLYGTLKAEVFGKLREGKDILASIDVQGVATIRKKAEEDPELGRCLVTVFLAPPSMGILAERLKRRGKDSAQVIERRLEGARKEILAWNGYDYLVISSSISEDVRRLEAIITAEKLRSCRAEEPRCLREERGN